MEDVLRSLTKALKLFELGETEIRIYSLLQSEELTPRQIAKRLDISERVVREKLKHLLQLGLIERQLVDRGWLGYIYYAKNPGEAINELLKRLENVLQNIEETTARNLKG
ncbi:TrmB family transcriptional regulator [Thermococcus profundus]|uniref:TrmB family transcriptional regulator n=1 Tax=Thermococcus profundus TaxID=49899 RepID=A0A2Z2MEZ0_THEPR|nr:helix-turn-helix domain-containing protein [Thermococcus profundus]ASJ03245.1 TrmB family transcriptional regulator [Thermococcus profundus]